VSQIAKTKETANKESNGIESFTPGPFPLKEKTEPRRISSKVQNKLKVWWHQTANPKISLIYFAWLRKTVVLT
jgi:hypothetical protein